MRPTIAVFAYHSLFSSFTLQQPYHGAFQPPRLIGRGRLAFRPTKFTDTHHVVLFNFKFKPSSKAKAKLVRFESEPSCAPLLIKAAVVAQDPSSMPSPGCTAPAGGETHMQARHALQGQYSVDTRLKLDEVRPPHPVWFVLNHSSLCNSHTLHPPTRFALQCAAAGSARRPGDAPAAARPAPPPRCVRGVKSEFKFGTAFTQQLESNFAYK